METGFLLDIEYREKNPSNKWKLESIVKPKLREIRNMFLIAQELNYKIHPIQIRK